MDSWLMGRGAHEIDLIQLQRLIEQIDDYEREFKKLYKIKIRNYDERLHGDSLKNVLLWAKDIVATDAKVVAVSKFLHHLLPNLIVPIDTVYTAKFLHDCNDQNRRTINYNEVLEIKRLTNYFRDMAVGSWDKLSGGADGRYANTSDTKTIDNWIIMWVDLKLNNR
jgi:hypothetical protein